MERVKDYQIMIWEQAIVHHHWSEALRQWGLRQQVMWTVYLRELHELGNSFRSRAVAFLIVALMVLSAVVHASRYRSEVRIYQDTWETYTGSMQGASMTDLLQQPYPVMKPPWELAFLADGGQRDAPDVYRIALSHWENLPDFTHRRGVGDRLHAAESLDWVFLIRVVLSMATFLLGYDVICGHRQRAALRVVLSYAVDRWQVVVAKILALWTLVSSPFVVGAILSLVVLTMLGGFQMNSLEWGKTLAILVLGIWSSSFFALVAILVSLWAREAGRSLTLLALVWVILVVVIPGGSGLVAQRLEPLSSEAQTEEKLAEIRDRSSQEGDVWRQPSEARKDGFVEEKASAERQRVGYEKQLDVLQGALEQQFNQVQLARTLSLLSPMMIIQDLGERLVGSGNTRDRSFAEQAMAFRSDLEAHAKHLDLQDENSPHIYFFPTYMSGSVVIDAAAIPVFEFRESRILEGFEAAAPRVLWLFFLTVVFFSVVLMSFAGYDVG